LDGQNCTFQKLFLPPTCWYKDCVFLSSGFEYFSWLKKIPYVNVVKQEIIVLCWIQFITNLSQITTRILEISRKTVDKLAETLEKLNECGTKIVFLRFWFPIHARHQGQRRLLGCFFQRIRGLLLRAEPASFLKRISEAYKLLFNQNR
jgi:hypothetical protein